MSFASMKLERDIKQLFPTTILTTDFPVAYFSKKCLPQVVYASLVE